MNQGTKKIRITQVKSGIGQIKEQKRTLKALGISKRGHSVVKENTPCIRGMIKAVEHLIVIEDERGE